jgi:hypothetical protein
MDFNGSQSGLAAGVQQDMDGFYVIGSDFAGFVAPQNAEVGQHGGKVGVGQCRAHLPSSIFHRCESAHRPNTTTRRPPF